MARKATARKAQTKRKATGGRQRDRIIESKDVFSDEDDEAARQEQAMTKRTEIDQVVEYEEPTFEDGDSEVDEENAFNSEDEAAYGLFFHGKTRKEEEKDEKEDDDEEEDEGEGELLSDMLGTTPARKLSTASDDDDENEAEKLQNLSKLVDSLVEPKKKQKLAEIDSTFATSVEAGELTLGALVGDSINKPGTAVPDTQDDVVGPQTTSKLDVKRMRQQVQELEGNGTKLTLESARNPVDDARAQRKVAYEEKIQDVNVFEPVVRRNRQKETLDLRQQAPKLEKLTPAVLTSKFVAQTAMEKSVAALLEAGDLRDKTLAHDEAQELAQKHVSTEEVAARHRELAKLRSLLFYEEQKQKRIKKIKSKLYHKIRNAQDVKARAKQHDELRKLDPELARQLDDELASKRAHERLTLKHRNTSKWVQHQLRRGIQADEGTRRAIADQLRRGEELRQKMKTVESEEDEEDEEVDEEVDGDVASRVQRRLEKQASALVTEIVGDSDNAGKKRGLEGMKFMQRAAAKQREKARVEAEKLLRELRTGEYGDEDRILGKEDAEEEEGGERKRVCEPSGGKTSTRLAVRVSGPIAIDLGDGGGTLDVVSDDKSTNKTLELGAKATAGENEEEMTSENPWVAPSALNKSNSRHKSKKKSRVHHENTNIVADALESLLSDTNVPETLKSDTTPHESLTSDTTPHEETALKRGKKRGKKRKGAVLTPEKPAIDETSTTSVEPSSLPSKRSKSRQETRQNDLVRRAFEFVADNEDEIAQEKEKLAGEDAEAKQGAELAKLVGMAGWGSWAGDGVRVSKRQVAREKKAQEMARDAKAKALARRRDAAHARVLINEKKDKKAAAFQVQDVPYPFTSREEYHAAMRNPLGSEWNTAQVTNVLTAPKVMKHMGTIIQPLVLSKEERKQAKKDWNMQRKAKL